MNFKTTIEGLLPRYNYLLTALEDAKEDLKITDEKIQEYHDEASACRDSLMLQFVHLESTAKKMTELKDYEVLTRNVLIAAQQFLHKHMFTLQMLPKHNDIEACRKQVREGVKNLAESEVNVNQTEAKEPIVANKEAMQEKLSVLQEQEAQLRRFLKDALQDGRGDEAALLHRALTECKDEIAKLAQLLK